MEGKESTAPKSMGLMMLAGLVALGFTAHAHAEVTQRVALIYDDDMGNRVDDDGDEIRVPTSGDINRAIFAALPADVPGAEGYSSRGSVGVFGQLGVQAETRRTGRMVNQVIIFSDEHVNLTGVPQHAVARFIIDGGEATLVAGEESKLEFQLNLESRVFVGNTQIGFAERWQGGFELEVFPGAFDLPTFTPFGEDIRATFDGVNHVDIDFSFQTFDLGIIPANGRIELEYFLHIEADIKRYSEITNWQFSDPLTVEMGGGEVLAPTITFLVPEPGTGFVLAAFAVLAAPRRRTPTHFKSTPNNASRLP